MQGVGFPDSLNSAPPPCLASHESCRAKPQDCNSTTAQNWFHHTARLHSPALDNPSASSLRVFFLDGHSGPLNDMLAFLQGMGGGTADATADALRFSGMVFGQAIDHLEHIDGPSFTDRRCRGGALGTNLSHRRSPCSTRMPPATFHEAFHQYHSSGASQPPQPMPPPPDVCLHVLAPLLAPNSTSTRPLPTPPRVHAFLCGKRPSAKGGCTVVPDCDRRRCRDALYVDSLVKEFAARFGRELQQARPDGIPCFRSMSHLSNPIPSHAVSHTLAVSHHTAVSAPSSVSHLYPVGAYSTSESAPCALLASPCWSP